MIAVSIDMDAPVVVVVVVMPIVDSDVEGSVRTFSYVARHQDKDHFSVSGPAKGESCVENVEWHLS